MLIGAGVPLPAGFDDAQARLAKLIRGGLLGGASSSAYDRWRTALARGAPRGNELGMSRLAQVQFTGTVAHGNRAIWPPRWEVAAPHGAPVPVLDADIMLTPAGQASPCSRYWQSAARSSAALTSAWTR